MDVVVLTCEESDTAEFIDADRRLRGPGESGDGGVTAGSRPRRTAGDGGALGDGEGCALGRGDTLTFLDLVFPSPSPENNGRRFVRFM